MVNHIFGGGSHTSRLYQRGAREARVLPIRNPLQPVLDGARPYPERGHRDPAPARAAETLDDHRSRRRTGALAAEGPTQEELDKAKAYLKGSYALNFDTSGKIAGQILQIQLDKLGIDYPERRNALLDAVTLADAKRVAKRLLDTKTLTLVVGRAQGLTKTN